MGLTGVSFTLGDLTKKRKGNISGNNVKTQQ